MISQTPWTPMTRSSVESVRTSAKSLRTSAMTRTSAMSMVSNAEATDESAASPSRYNRFSTGSQPRRGTRRTNCAGGERLSQRTRNLAKAMSIMPDSDSDEISTDDEFLVTGIRKEQLRNEEAKNLLSGSSFFKSTTGMIIMLNTVVIALEAVYIQQRLRVFDILEVTFTVFYTLEIAWRMWEKGIIYFLTTEDFWWNWFDLVITGLSLIDTLMQCMMATATSGASVARLFRVFRILRMFRAMRFLHEVDYVLAHAAMATIKLSAVVSIVLFVASIIATNMLWDCQDAIIAGMFRDLGMSMWSMFKLMTLDDWIPVSERVIKVKPGMLLFFVVFIFSTSIALISLVPAIFIEISLSSRTRQEKLDAERIKITERRQKTRLLRTLFKVTDQNDNGRISVAEMKRVLTDDTYFRRLQEAGLTDSGDLRDIRLGLFDLWEETLEETARQEAEITEEEFTGALLRVSEDVSQGSLWRSTTATRLMLRDFANVVKTELRNIRDNAKKLDSNMELLFGRLQESTVVADWNQNHKTDKTEVVEEDDKKPVWSPTAKATLMGGAMNADLRIGRTLSEFGVKSSSIVGVSSYSSTTAGALQSTIQTPEAEKPSDTRLSAVSVLSNVTEEPEEDSGQILQGQDSWYPQHLVTTDRIGFGENGRDDPEKDYIPPDIVGSGMMFERCDSFEPLIYKAAKITRVSPRGEGGSSPLLTDRSL